MYLNTVLDAIARKGAKFTAEDLYKLNEAIFNLPEVDVVNQKTTLRLFQALESVMKAYSAGGSRKRDQSFFYDYVALLATMQNQHFFNDSQNRTLLTWLYEALQEELGPPRGQSAKGGKGAAAAPVKDVSPQLKAEVARLEAENEALKKEVEKLRELAEAVVYFQKYKAPAAPKAAEQKDKAKSKDKKKRRSKGEKGEKGEKEDGEEDKKEEEEEKKEEKEEKAEKEEEE